MCNQRTGVGSYGLATGCYCTQLLNFFVLFYSFCDFQRTFSELSDPADLHRKCQELCQCLAEDMQKERVQVC